ncbi:hypothetical protein, partial [Staphylococcus aureus]|uniref:hypothetical protein n=1 Tax=Staphylococcus aureus TaxID=1280 RepID=UPI001E391250
LYYLVMPITLIVVALLFALFAKNPKRKRRGLITGIILLLFFTNPFLENEAMSLWEEAPKPISTLGTYDAAIILTGITNQQKSPYDRI